MSSATLLLPRTSAALASFISDETGTGALVFGTNPTLAGITLNGVFAAQGWNFTLMGNVQMGDTNSIQTLDSGGAQFHLAAYDVDGAAYTNFITLTAGNTPTCDLSIATTVGGKTIAQGFTPYTPTLTNVTNIAASATSDFGYYRVGNYVTVEGRITIDPTAAAVATELGISLPIASNFTLFTHCGGSAISSASAGLCAAVRADTTNDRAQVVYINTAELASREFMVHFTYEVK